MAKKGRGRSKRPGARGAAAPAPRPRPGARAKDPAPAKIRGVATARRAGPASEAAITLGTGPASVESARELFWQNVVQEILTDLAMICAQRPANPRPKLPAPALPAEGGSEALQFDPAMFDGRMALILKDGQRIGIADVTPLFACGISAPDQRALAMAVECSVFQVRTPDGHVFTIPLHEIRAFHSMTPELWDRVQRQARAARPRRTRRGETDEVPFGFAAFTSMARGIAGMPALPGEAPAGPTE